MFIVSYHREKGTRRYYKGSGVTNKSKISGSRTKITVLYIERTQNEVVLNFEKRIHIDLPFCRTVDCWVGSWSSLVECVRTLSPNLRRRVRGQVKRLRQLVTSYSLRYGLVEGPERDGDEVKTPEWKVRLYRCRNSPTVHQRFLGWPSDTEVPGVNRYK